MSKIFLFHIALFLSIQSFGQFSVKEKDIHYKRRLVRSIPLSNPVNQKLFGEENLVVKILLDAFEKGSIKGFADEDFSKELSFFNFSKKIEVKEEDTLYHLDYKFLNVVEIGEDLIVDKHRSEIIFDMESVTIFLPAKYNPRDINEPLITFRYDDCVKIFKNDRRAFSFNPLRNGRNINFSETLLLRLHLSEIVRIGDSSNPYFDQLTNDPIQAFLYRKNAENELTEMLYKLFNPK